MDDNVQTYLTEEDISQLFDKNMAMCLEMEEGNTRPDEQLLGLIQSFQDVQQNIIRLHLFSPNEEFDELKSEHLKYLLMPYFIGDCFSRISNPETRRTNLHWSEVYFTEYFNLAQHYELVPKTVLTQFKKIKEQKRSYQVDRESKIANFKENKELNLKLKNLEKLDDEKHKREIVGVQVIKRLYSVIDQIPLNYQELDILDFKDKMNTQKQVADQYKEESKKPVPKMKVWNIPKPNESFPYLFNTKEGQACHGCGAQTESEQRHDHITKVWQPGANMPTMTLDEFADMEIKNMQQQEAIQKKAMEEAKKQQELEDPDKDEWSDQQTLKDREWDNWKDENEKGAGNKGGR